MSLEASGLVVLVAPVGEAFRVALEGAGFEVLTVESVDDCLAQLLPSRWSAAVVDADSLGAGLRDVVARLAAETRVVVLSADRTAEHVVALMQTGAIDVLARDGAGHPAERLVASLQALRDSPSRSTAELLVQVRQLTHACVHDVKNPVGNVLGYADLLADSARMHGQTDDLEFVERIRSNCLLVIDRLRQFAAAIERLGARR
jgi:signal transduction histidine kinase